MEEIRQLRESIDDLDREIVDLLNRRCVFVRQIGEWKKAHRRPIYVPERERQLLDKLISMNRGPLENESLIAIYREIMSAAIKLEHPLLIGCIAPTPEFPRDAVLEKFGHGVSSIEFPSFPELCRALTENRIDYAITPVESTATGVVAELLDALAGSKVQIVTEFTIHVGGNLSRFLILGMQEAEPTGKDKTSLCFELPDRTGSLQEALKIFVARSINLAMLEIRPLRTQSFEYRFFVDILGHVTDPPVKEAVDELHKKCAFFRILGSYPRMN